VESKGKERIEEGPLSKDPFPKLVTTAAASKAHVTVTWGRAGSFGDPKVSVAVSLVCDQTQAMIYEAGRLAYETAVEMVDDAIKDFDSKAGP